MKRIIISLLVLLCITQTSVAVVYDFDVDGYGTYSHTYYGVAGTKTLDFLDYDAHDIYYRLTWSGSADTGDPDYPEWYYFTGLYANPPPNAWTIFYGGYGGGDEGLSHKVVSYHNPSNEGVRMSSSGLFNPCRMVMLVSQAPIVVYTISGDVDACVDWVDLYQKVSGEYIKINSSTSSPYSFEVVDNTDYKLTFSDGAYHDFTCIGDEVFNYDACLYVYGYTCGVGDIHLYVDDDGWVLEDSVSQSMLLANYEMAIEDGKDYKLNMHGISQLVDTYLFSCTGDHVLYSYDRCVYPPSPSPYYPIDPIILWEGYDYNIVLLRDNHGNYIENAQVAIYDQTNSTYIQKWTPNPDGYLLLGALFNDSDHNTKVMVRTFDGVFTLETTYPANGSALVGSEDVTQTNMTIPIHYNIQMDTQDQFGTPLTGVFCGLSEYTPLNPLSFWGYSMGGRQYVPVTNCSGFAMCDIYAEKGGYGDYDVTGLNWTSRSAMVKDYRHEIVMVKE